MYRVLDTVLIAMGMCEWNSFLKHPVEWNLIDPFLKGCCRDHTWNTQQCWAYNKLPGAFFTTGSAVKALALRTWPSGFRPRDPHKKQDVMASIRIPSSLPWRGGRWRQRLTRKLVGQLVQCTWSRGRNNQNCLAKERKERTDSQKVPSDLHTCTIACHGMSHPSSTWAGILTYTHTANKYKIDLKWSPSSSILHTSFPHIYFHFIFSPFLITVEQDWGQSILCDSAVPPQNWRTQHMKWCVLCNVLSATKIMHKYWQQPHYLESLSTS